MERKQSKRWPNAGRGNALGGAGAWGALAAAACTLAIGLARAQTCAEPKAADFKKTVLLSSGLTNPVHLAVASDGRVFIGEMSTGNIQVYKPGQTAPVLAGTVPTRYENEDGLLGIAVPPDFASSHFLYVLASDPSKTDRAHVLWRYTVTGDKLDAASKTEIIRIPRVAGGIYHAGGGMVIDKKGNLWWSEGDDTNPHGSPNDGYGPLDWKDPGKDGQKSASNTNDLRGKINRIHPEAAMTAGKWYTIPAGNLKETMGSFWNATELAKVRPEIFAFGMRNPYRFTVDDQTGWLIWGEVGPDANDDNATRGRMGHDEFNVAPKPGYYGWPYCNGNQFAYNSMDYSGGEPGVPGSKFDCSALVNNSPNNTGVNKLPPALPPIIWYAGNNKTDFQQMGGGGETAMSGPMYRYDKNLKSATKFPPQYDGRIAIWDWSRRVHKMITLTGEGKLDKFYEFPATGMNSDISAQYGPDGSLYMLQYSENGYGDSKSSLLRIDYTGAIDESCAPVSLARAPADRAQAKVALIPAGLRSLELSAGVRGFEAFDLSGRKVWSYLRPEASASLRVELPAGLAAGLLRVRYF